MMTDWRGLCECFVQAIEEGTLVIADKKRVQGIIDCTRAALAQSEPEGQMSVSKIAQILLAHSSVEPMMGIDRIIYQTSIMPIANEICERFAKPESDGTANEKS